MLFDGVIAHPEELIRHGQRVANQVRYAIGLVDRVGLEFISQ